MEAVKRAKNIKISVIMGVYNPTQKQQLFAAVRSIIGQTFPWWEMIIYDDGSSPDYAETIREAAHWMTGLSICGKTATAALHML